MGSQEGRGAPQDPFLWRSSCPQNKTHLRFFSHWKTFRGSYFFWDFVLTVYAKKIIIFRVPKKARLQSGSLQAVSHRATCENWYLLRFCTFWSQKSQNIAIFVIFVSERGFKFNGGATVPRTWHRQGVLNVGSFSLLGRLGGGNFGAGMVALTV